MTNKTIQPTTEINWNPKPHEFMGLQEQHNNQTHKTKSFSEREACKLIIPRKQQLKGMAMQYIPNKKIL